jgi:hypothetical protein
MAFNPSVCDVIEIWSASGASAVRSAALLESLEYELSPLNW